MYQFWRGGQQYWGWNYNNISETRLILNVATARLLDALRQFLPSVVIQWKCVLINNLLSVDICTKQIRTHAGPSVVGLRLLVCWNYGFQSRRGLGCSSAVSVVCCQVEVSATSWSLVQRSPIDCGASLCVVYTPQEWGGPGPSWAAGRKKNRNL